MKKIRCINNGCFSRTITVGRVYEVLSESENYYRFADDIGEERGCFKHRFEVVEDHDGSVLQDQMILPTDPQERKGIPITTGVLDYFPLAIAEVARLSKAGNDQHNPGEPLHWDRSKSTDHADTIGRHLIDRGKLDSDGQRHSAKLAWRALALLQTELEAEAAAK